MTTELTILFALLIGMLALLIWGRWRYDLVAFGALVLAVITGVVPAEEAFSGFGHAATVVIALVLVLGRGLSNSGVVDQIVRHVVDRSRSLHAHVTVLGGVAALLSTLMNNVAALTLLMPVDVETARRSGRSPARTLMPLSFASILGGMVTLIGTPPNIVIAQVRADTLGESFRMFDYTPVGIVCAAVGVAFVTLVGWRLLPDRVEARSDDDEAVLEGYIAELQVPEDSDVVGQRVEQLDEAADESDAAILGVVRDGERMPGFARSVAIQAGDVLVVEAGPEAIEKLASSLDLDPMGKLEQEASGLAGDLSLLEVAVPVGSRLEGRTARSLGLMHRHGVALMGVSRQGQRFRERVRRVEIRAGDVVLLMGPADRLQTVARELGCLPIAESDLPSMRGRRTGLAVLIFGAAVAAASFGLIDLTVALAAAVVGMVVVRILPPRQIYDAIEWEVIVLIGSLIPIGQALETSGGTALIADTVVAHSNALSPVVILVLLMVVTMTLSDVLNNVATALIAAPVAVEIAQQLGVNPDTYLMGVAVAASSAFLTPIGHKNNTLVLGPGGYRFGDYWRMGLPLEVLILTVATPMLLKVWPL